MVRGIKPENSSIFFLMLSLLFTVIGVIYDSFTLIIFGIVSFFYSIFAVFSGKRLSAVVPMPHERFRASAIIIVGAVILILLALKLAGAI